jgi:protein-export membrane protein SecD
MQQKHYIFIAVVILAIVAGIFAYPNYFNKLIDSLNEKMLWNLPKFPEKPYIFGLDLQGGVQLIYEADLSSIEDKSGAMSGLRDVIERRVNLFGVSEPTVQIQGNDRLLVELPGVTDVQEAIQMIGETPYLEFLEMRTEEETEEILKNIEQIQSAQEQGLLLEDMEGLEFVFEHPYFKPTELTGKYLQKATVVFDQTTYKPQIQLKFNDEGAKIFEEVTARNIQKPIAIFLDGASIIDTTGDGIIDAMDLYAPIVQDKITGGVAVITGDMPTQTANSIARRLNSGALPVKIGEPISQETIGPVLGAVSLQRSLVAGMYGLLAVIIFMILIYRLPGVLASIALMIYVALVLSVFKLIPVTLTLAGIGGFVLSIGLAVDANILIFARMREEIKSGKGLSQAIDEGFKRAWPSIKDSNFNSLIVCAILFFVATSFIKGFALTLAIGILFSMFSAFFVTRIFLQVFLGAWTKKFKWII